LIGHRLRACPFVFLYIKVSKFPRAHNRLNLGWIQPYRCYQQLLYVVDAVNSHPNFKSTYPKEHDKQQSIVEGFRQVSGANFACCTGAIDRILIWVHRPRERDCIESGCSAGKFFCGRKKMFGLNCQAVSDVNGRILDISIMYPGSTSDCLAFKGMTLFQKLESSMLAPGLCLLGNIAYLNTLFLYMATPYAAVSGGSRMHIIFIIRSCLSELSAHLE
jgi:hypothetical protein